MFNKAKAYIRMRLEQHRFMQAAKRHPCPNPGVAHVTGYGDRFGGDKAIQGAVIISRRPVDLETGEKGEWETVHADTNLVVTQAERLMALMAIGASGSPLNYIELGDAGPPASPPSLGDINLEQTTSERKTLTLTTSGNVLTAEATWLTTEGNGRTYTEAALFTGPFAAGTMFARKVFTGIFKTLAFEMRFTWLITFLVQTQGGDCAGIALTGPSTLSSHTIYVSPTGGEQSVATTFDFVPNSNLLDVFLNGQRLEPGTHYTESGPPLALPQGGGVPAVSKGIDLGFTLLPADRVLLVHRAIQ